MIQYTTFDKATGVIIDTAWGNVTVPAETADVGVLTVRCPQPTKNAVDLTTRELVPL